MTKITLGFLMKPVMISADNILPSRVHLENLQETHKYRQIRESIREIDLIEPLSVSALNRQTGKHLLLDGHIRMIALSELGATTFPCIVASDDEAYTYNNRVSRLSSIQEHLMCRRAVERGVSAERLAKALCLDLTGIQKRLSLLDGICQEAAELLKDRQFSIPVAGVLKKMKPTRQVECVELMISANAVTRPYASSLLMATHPDLLVGKRPHPTKSVSHEQMDRMEREMSNIQDQYKSAEETYGEDMLNLVLARGYVVKLLDNDEVRRYLKLQEPELLEQFLSLVESTSMDLQQESRR